MNLGKHILTLKNATALMLLAFGMSGCASIKNVLGVQSDKVDTRPIQNPFADYSWISDSEKSVTLRSRQGDRTVEVELPKGDHQTDVVMPLIPESGNQTGRGLASVSEAQSYPAEYSGIAPTHSDREITSRLPNMPPEQEWKRREIENGLGVMPTETLNPDTDQSYLASVDKIKQYFRLNRYEASLIELDRLIKVYPTDPKLHEMRGTVLDRLGFTELAVKSWEESLEYNPSNLSLRRYIERKGRGVAGGVGK